MRLLHKQTLTFEWFTDENIPPFLILSHRWQGNETTLQGFLQRDVDPSRWNSGIEKIVNFCEQATIRPEEYVWIDTCCIDKSSSTELQEAINSMYRWYEQASMCIVYLDDVNSKSASPAVDEIQGQLQSSRWFTRGWTLQELLAPRNQLFVDREWKLLGTRDDLAEVLANITKIDAACFGHADKIRSQSVATRMSWISRRTTSRIEDHAYCMLGIFDVAMPMLYGEGKKAFYRLQTQILQDLDDESIFLWSPQSECESTTMPILAPSPACFAICNGVRIEKDTFFDREPYRMTTKGLELELYGPRISQFESELTVLLNCTWDGRRPYFCIRKGRGTGRNWQRNATKDIQTADADAHDSPPSAWEQFESTSRQLQMQSAGFGRGNMNGVPTAMAHASMLAVSNFKQERTRYKLLRFQAEERMRCLTKHLIPHTPPVEATTAGALAKRGYARHESTPQASNQASSSHEQPVHMIHNALYFAEHGLLIF